MSARTRLLLAGLIFLSPACLGPDPAPEPREEPSTLDVSGEPFDPSDAVLDDDAPGRPAPPPEDDGAGAGGS